MNPQQQRREASQTARGCEVGLYANGHDHRGPPPMRMRCTVAGEQSAKADFPNFQPPVSTGG